MTALTVDQVRKAVAREWGRYVDLLSCLDAGEAGSGGDWERPTRLAGWTVTDLAAHTVWGVSMEADALRRARTGEAGVGEGRFVEASPEPKVVLDELKGAVRSLLDELGHVADGDPARPVPMPYGSVPMEVVLSIVVMEAGVHANDLAAALGREEDLPADVRAATAPVLRAYLPVVATGSTDRPPEGTTVTLEGPSTRLVFRFSGGRWEADDTADPTAAITADDDSTILLFALGRIGPADRRLNATDRDVLESFKRWCPGL